MSQLSLGAHESMLAIRTNTITRAYFSLQQSHTMPLIAAVEGTRAVGCGVQTSPVNTKDFVRHGISHFCGLSPLGKAASKATTWSKQRPVTQMQRRRQRSTSPMVWLLRSDSNNRTCAGSCSLMCSLASLRSKRCAGSRLHSYTQDCCMQDAVVT